jgi:hypothetical protein
LQGEEVRDHHLPKNETGEMSKLSFVLLIVTGLALTAYFGVAAWRLTDDSHMDITGHIPRGTR